MKKNNHLLKMERKIVNPETGRKIKVNGPTYKRLVAEGAIRGRGRTKTAGKRKASPARRKVASAGKRKTSPARRRVASAGKIKASPIRRRMPSAGKKRAGPSPKTRRTKRLRKTPEKIKLAGLSKKVYLSPSKKKKLSALKKNVGEGRGSRTRGWSVLAPQHGRQRHELKAECGNKCFLDPVNEKFPVCARHDINKKCEISCRGITAAKVRARQYGYEDIYRKAEKLEKKYC